MIAVDWITNPVLESDAPIIAVLPTLCGCAQTNRSWLHGFSEATGFRIAVLNRRGHGGLALRTPRFNVFGDPEDTQVQLEHVKRAYPDSRFLGAIGISAGSAQIATYLGTTGDESLVDAAVCACPAYDVSTAFGYFAQESPRLDSFLLSSVQTHWLRGRSGETLASAAAQDMKALDALRRAESAPTMEKFVEAHAYFAGCREGSQQYYEVHNPMSHFRSVARPLLLLNSDDDPVCLHTTIPTEIPVHGCAIVRTDYGSHTAFVDGVYFERSWMMDVGMKFLVECHKEHVAAL